MIVYHIEHLDDTSRTDIAFHHAGKETVATKIIQAIYIQLTGNELMQKSLGILVGKNLDGDVQFALEFLVESFHQAKRNFFVRNTFKQRMFQYVREGSVADIVQHDGGGKSFGFCIGDFMAFQTQLTDGFGYQKHGTGDMLKATMRGAWIHYLRQSQLNDTREAIQVGMLVQIVQKSGRQVDKPEYRIVDYFLFGIHRHR